MFKDETIRLHPFVCIAIRAWKKQLFSTSTTRSREALLEKFILSAAKIFIETTTAYFEVDICNFNLNIATKALTISLFGYIIAYSK
jgi:hypothetical protein